VNVRPAARLRRFERRRAGSPAAVVLFIVASIMIAVAAFGLFMNSTGTSCVLEGGVRNPQGTACSSTATKSYSPTTATSQPAAGQSISGPICGNAQTELGVDAVEIATPGAGGGFYIREVDTPGATSGDENWCTGLDYASGQTFYVQYELSTTTPDAVGSTVSSLAGGQYYSTCSLPYLQPGEPDDEVAFIGYWDTSYGTWCN
jgi:hypothetical protein